MATSKASSIGWMFVPQYYTFVNKDPAKLHCFYTKRSTLIHGVEGEDCLPVSGQVDIHEKIMALGYEDCKVFVSTVDSQSSAENGIVVQVVGELSNKGGPWRKFAQTFFLAEQPNGYFVLNDIFRYIKEESDDEEAVEDEQEQEEIAAAAATTDPADVLVTLDQPLNANSTSTTTSTHQDFQLSQGHGAPEAAAGVTFNPPMDQQANGSSTRASLEGLVNGDVQQEQVVELHDEINEEQPEQSGHIVSHANGVQHDEPMADEAATPEVQETAVRQENEAPVEAEAEPEVEQLQQDPTPAEAEPEEQATPAEAPAAPSSSSAPAATQPQLSSPAPPSTVSTPQTQQPAAPAPSKPAAPKSWASLAATGSNQWKQVKSDTRGVSSSSSVPASRGASGSSTPATSSNAPKPSAPAASLSSPSASLPAATSASEKESSDGFITAGPRRSGGGDRDRDASNNDLSNERNQTRTPNFSNVETGFSAIVHNVQQNISHGLLRNRLSDEFARTNSAGRKEWAKLSYLDIDRAHSVAYIDFESEWALERAVKIGKCPVDGVECKVTAGKGGRRDASGFGTGQRTGGAEGRIANNQGKGRAPGGPLQQLQGERRGAGRGNGQNAPRGGAGGRVSSGGRGGGQQ